jgi:uncharacterized membrane protein YfcA
MENKTKKPKLLGLVTGITNGLFGSGGGMVAVPMLASTGMETKKTHATSLALILPLSIVSCFLYARHGDIQWATALKLIPFGLGGAVLGSLMLKKISSVWLKRAFGVILIIAGIRLIF